MPVVTNGFKGGAGALASNEIALPPEPQEDQKRDETNEYVQAMETRQRKKRGCENVCADLDAALEQFPIFTHLPDEEDGAKDNC